MREREKIGEGGGWKRKHNMIQIEMSIQCLFETMVINSKREIDREREKERDRGRKSESEKGREGNKIQIEMYI